MDVDLGATLYPENHQALGPWLLRFLVVPLP